MKSNLSKFCKTLLLGAAFAVVGCTDYDEDIRKVNDDLTSSVASLEKTISDLETKLKSEYALKSEVDQFKSDLEKSINDKIAEVNTSIAALDQAVKQNAEDIKKAVSDAQTAVAEANAAIKNLQDTKADKTEVDKMKKDLEAKITALEDALGTLGGSVEENKNDIARIDVALTALNATVDGIAKRLDVLEASVEQNAKDIAALLADCEELKNSMDKAENDIEANRQAIEAEVQARILAIKSLQTIVDARYEEYKAHVEAYNKKIAELEQEDADLKAAIDQLNKLVADHADAIEALQAEDSRLAGLIDDLQDDIDALQVDIKRIDGEIENITGNIDSIDSRLKKIEDILKNRVQSLVYVPDYNDGKATVNVLNIGTADEPAYIEGTSTLTYKVNPSELASVLAQGTDVFSFDVIGVKTRAEAPEINIIGAKADDTKGTITFTVETRNFVDEFYSGPKSGTQSYSAALVLKKDENYDNISSEYTNLVPAVEAAEMKIFDRNDKDITGLLCTEEILEFPYTKRDSLVALEGHKLVFVIGGKVIEQSEMEENGYDVEVLPGIATEYFPAEAEASFVIDEDKNAPYATVSLSKGVGKENVSESAIVLYKYTCKGVTAVTSVPCEIIKERAEITIVKKAELNWNYSYDAETDAKLLNGEDASYSRTGFRIAKDEFSFVNVPADADLEAIIKGAVTASPEAEASFSCEAKSGDILIDFSGFEWGKTYTLTGKYDTESIELIVKVEIQTIDRNRKPVIVNIDSTVVTYAKDFELAKGEKLYSLNPLFSALTDGKNLGVSEIPAIKYFDDILSAYYDAEKNKNTVDATYDAPLQPTDGMFTVLGFAFNSEDGIADEDKFVITPGFTYRSFPNKTIKPEVLYTKNFTTWYGQEITITHKLKFEYPIYNFQHSRITVAQDNAGAYFTQVLPLYEPNAESAEVSGFSMDNVTMSKEFNIVDGNLTILDDEAIAEAGLVAEYEILGTAGAGIVMNDNVLTYNDKDDVVRVRGNLFLVSANGARMQLPTSFDEGQAYATYYVKKYDPIGQVEVMLKDELGGNIAIKNAVDYKFNILDYITLKDNRPFGSKSYDLITKSTSEGAADAHWTIGDGINGFAAGNDVKDIYGLAIAYTMDVNKIPVEYRKYITFDENTGILTFLASGMSRLQTVLPVDIKFNVEYTWGTREVTIPFRFYSPEL